MLYIGIDFSLNSTAMCIQKDNEEEDFYSIHRVDFRKKDLPIYKESSIYFLELEKFNAYDKNIKKKNHEIEFDKLQKAVDQCNIIIDIIENFNEEFVVSIEGFSYNGVGKRSIDLAGFQYVLRSMLYTHKNFKNLFVFTPTEIKKYAVKGNATKIEMIDMFGSILNSNNPLSRMLSAHKEHFNKFPKPIDDLVDSYYAKELLKSTIK